MRGDWLASRDTEAGKPFTRAIGEEIEENRLVFSLNKVDNPPSGLFQAEGQWYQGSWCKYYWKNVYAASPDPSKLVQCDEFPWASSRQGAANANGHFSIRAISTSHNRAHGTALGTFYKEHRMIAGDSFWYEIVP